MTKNFFFFFFSTSYLYYKNSKGLKFGKDFTERIAMMAGSMFF